MPDGFDLDVTLEMSPVVLMSHPEIVEPPEFPSFQIRPSNRGPDLDSANAGRVIRCWHNSLII